ncbi:hypothetical protein KKG81_08565 [bacterium]|nr:hypothetical protein [bacterium]
MEEKVYHEDEIDLRDLFRTIWDKRVFILVFTLVVTLISVVYVYFKNPIPIYQGKAYIEIGQIQSQNFGQISLNTAADTVGVLMLEFKVSANILKGTNNILEISSTNEDKNLIKENLEKSIESIINKHKEKSSFYENVIMTKQIGNIIIDKEAINKSKTTLIIVVSFVTGFILAIFVLFLIQFVNTMRKED